MKPNTTDRDLEQLLANPVPPPPAGLAKAIKDEIELVEGGPQSAPSRYRSWMVAASVLVALGAGIFTSRLFLFRTELPTADAETARASETPEETFREGSPGAVEDRAEPDSPQTPLSATLDPFISETGNAPSELGRELEADRRALTSEPLRETTELAEELQRLDGDEVRRARKTLPIPNPTPATQPSLEGRLAADANRTRRRQESGQESPLVAGREAAGDAETATRAKGPRGVGASESRTTLNAIQAAPPPPPQERAAYHDKLRSLRSGLQEQEAPVPGAPRPTMEAPPVATAPNGAPYKDVFFRGHGVNPFVDTDDDTLSTFGLDVDTASYSVVRRFLNDGHLPPPAAVRVEELVNYLDYGDPTLVPEAGQEFALTAEGAPALFAPGEGYHVLRLHLQGRNVAAENRPPSDLVFVVDTSGSMAKEGRIELVKRSLGLLLDGLGENDRVGLVEFGTEARVLVEPTRDTHGLRRAIAALTARGSTNAAAGLTLGYELTARHRRKGTSRRVVLCSDGVANVGQTAAEQMLANVRSHAEKGIELTTVGFGMGNYNDHLMETLADDGNGRYAYVDTLSEARRLFVEELTGTLLTIAAEARAQIEFDPAVVSRYRLLGYENRDIADTRFRDDSVDAGEIGAGHRLTVLYQLKLNQPPKRKQVVATVRLRYASVALGEMIEQELEVRGGDFSTSWNGASPPFRMSSLVADFAEVLKETYWARGTDLGEIFRRAQRTAADLAESDDRAAIAELVSLIGKAEALSR